MAFVAGRNSQIICNSTNLSPYLRSASIQLGWDLADTTTFGNVGRTKLATTNSADLSMTGVWDPTQDSTITSVSGVDGALISFLPYNSSTVGDVAYLMYGATTDYSPVSEYNDAVTFDWSAQSEARVFVGQALHPLAEDTNTTTGSTKDDTAATTSGWTAFLHVTAVDAGSWVVTLEHATASNFSDGATVTGGTFTAATGATYQRLQSAAGATLNRYVRYVATRTGGAGGDGITFALVYARIV